MSVTSNYTYPRIYDEFFSPNRSFFKSFGFCGTLWNRCFRSVEYWSPFLANSEADFLVLKRRTAKELAKDVCIFAFKLLTLPVQISGYLIARVIMIPLYPAQSTFLSCFFDRFCRSTLAQERRHTIHCLTHPDFLNHPEFRSDSFVAKEVTLEKNGIKYKGVLVGHRDTIQNGKWAIQATGNGEPIESNLYEYAESYYRSGTNLLMINGPSVGESGGTAWPETMGDAQEVGISFLERAVKAKKIALIGRSLGGAAIASAILQHDFKEDVKYLVIDMVTFDRVSNVCSKIIGNRLVGSLVKLVGLEIDTVEASKKLQALNIPEIIIQATQRNFRTNPFSSWPDEDDFIGDGVIPKEASKGYSLVKEDVVAAGSTRFVGILNLGHNDFDFVMQSAVKELKNF